MPWELPQLMGRERAAAALETLRPLDRLSETVAGLRSERCIVSALELTWYMRNQLLRDADWAGMAHGVEIRVPFVDVALLRALAPMLAGANPPTKAKLVSAIGPPLSEEIAATPQDRLLGPGARMAARRSAARFEGARFAGLGAVAARKCTRAAMPETPAPATALNASGGSTRS